MCVFFLFSRSACNHRFTLRFSVFSQADIQYRTGVKYIENPGTHLLKNTKDLSMNGMRSQITNGLGNEKNLANTTDWNWIEKSMDWPESRPVRSQTPRWRFLAKTESQSSHALHNSPSTAGLFCSPFSRRWISTWFPPMPWQLKKPTFSFSFRPMLSTHWLVSTFLICGKKWR